MKQSSAELLRSIFVLIVGCLLGYFLEDRKDDIDKAPRYLDYEWVSSRVLPLETLIPGREVSVTIDNKAVDQLTRLDLFVYNYSDKDFEDVRFYIDLVPQDPTSPVSDLILGDWPAGANGIPDGVIPLSNLKPLRLGEARFGYDVHTLNRSELSNPSFKASYFILGDAPQPPYLRINVDKAGVNLRKLSSKRSPGRERWLTPRVLYSLYWIAFLLLVLGWSLALASLSSLRRITTDDNLRLLSPFSRFLCRLTKPRRNNRGDLA